MSDELKPCPFCGLDLELERGRGTEDREGAPTYLYCGICGAQGPWVYSRDPDEDYAVVEQWNNRAKPRLPWRKVSEEPLPKDGQWFLAIRINSHLPPYASMCFWSDQYGDFIVGPIPGATHWCYFDELKPEDAE